MAQFECMENSGTTSAALAQEVDIPANLDEWTDPARGAITVKYCHVLSTGGDEFKAIVVLNSPAKSAFNLYDGTCLRPLGQDIDPPLTTGELDYIWGAGADGLLVAARDHIHRIAIRTDGTTVSLTPLAQVPQKLLGSGLAATWVGDGPGGTGRLVAAALTTVPRDVSKPMIYPEPPRACSLVVYGGSEGSWEKVCAVPQGSAGLSISGNGQYAVWRVMRRLEGPEEAERGNVWGSRLAKGEECRRLTWATVRITNALVASDGTIVYQANHSEHRPITTHQDLWVTSWDADKDSAPVCLTGGGVYVEAWGWQEEGKKVWLSVISGVHPLSYILPLTTTLQSAKPLLQPITGVPSWDSVGRGLWPTGGVDVFMSLHDTGCDQPIKLPHASQCDDIVVEVVQWTAKDGLPITGMLAHLTTSPPTASLIVHIHGGPAVAQRADRTSAALSTRYPWRHLIQAGYYVFQPMYRGSLGFGDAFCQAIIGVQGQMGGDLGDVLQGIKYLRCSGRCVSEKVGLMGGSYGGYMTLRAMAMCPDVFLCGVAMYGFIHNRWMSFEVGDFTYEDEYLEADRRNSWPLTAEDTSSDVFDVLHRIRSPVLLMHGTHDDICPPSQSWVPYHLLMEKGVPTGLVLYPGERHGFDKAVHRRDRDRRTLAWFLQYLPPQ